MFGMTNPHVQHPHGFQQRFGINVWAGIVDGRLIGPYLLPLRLAGHTYFPARTILRIIARCVIGHPSMRLVSIRWRTTPFCKCGWSSPQPTFRAEMDRAKRPDCMASTTAGFNATQFLRWDHMKSLIHQIPVEDLLSRLLDAAKRFNRHQLYGASVPEHESQI